jgi:hypothetical protein
MLYHPLFNSPIGRFHAMLSTFCDAAFLLRRCHKTIFDYLGSPGPAPPGFTSSFPEAPAWHQTPCSLLPRCADLSSCPATATKPTLSPIESIIAAVHVLDWQQGCSESGFGADFMSRFGRGGPLLAIDLKIESRSTVE